MTQHRVLLAIADAELAQSASALAQEGEGLEVVDRIGDAEELSRALRRLEVDVVILHDALGSVPVLEVARDIATSFPEVGLVLIAADDSTEFMRAAMQAGLRDVVSLPLSLEQLEGSVRAASQWSRTMRDRVAGEESAAGALGGQLIAVAGSKGGVGTTTVCLQLALAAVRAAPGRPVCVVDFDLQKGDFRSFLDMPYRRSVVDLVEVADEISVRHLQETLYTHKEGFRVLLAPDEGERAEEVNALAARPILSAVKARHALTIVDLGAHRVGGERDRRRARQPRARRHPARRRLAARRQAPARPVEAPAGARGRRGRARRAQPRVAQARGPARPRAQGDRGPAGQDDDPRRVLRLRGGREYGYTGTYGGREAARELRPAARRGRRPPGGRREPDTDPSEPRGLLARLGGERGQSSAEMMGLLPVLIVIVLALWQVGLLGYTYLLAGHAAREGARELAVNTTDLPKDHPYRDAAQRDLPKAWRKDAKIEIDEDDPVTVNVKLVVPAVLPGLRSPFKVSDHASTSVEDDPLPPSQTKATPGSKS